MIYLIGSLRNPEVPVITKRLMDEGFDVFSEWYGAGERADDCFKEYHQSLGRSYLEALETDAAKTIFNFDKDHIDRSEAVILVAPAGKSGHLELGYALGRGRRGYYLLDDPERWDLMLQFATGIFTNIDDLIGRLKEDERLEMGPVPLGDGPICQHCQQRPVYKDWCRYCGREQQCHKCGFQWVPDGDGG